MAKKVKEETPEVTPQPVTYPLLKKSETYYGEISGTKFKVIPQRTAYNNGQPFKLPAIVCQNGKENKGEVFVDLNDEQKKVLKQIGMI